MDNILKSPSSGQTAKTSDTTNSYLDKNNYLGEFSTDAERQVARANLGVPATDSVYSVEDADIAIKKVVKDAIQSHLVSEDPHQVLPEVEERLKGVVKSDGSVPFTRPQLGVDPILDYHLATKRYILDVLEKHLNEDDPHEVVDTIMEKLQNYVTFSQVYLKRDLYNRNEVLNLLAPLLRNDGSVILKAPLVGVDPQIDAHLATKKYVDKKAMDHVLEVDPHGFISILNQRLAQYQKKGEVFSKGETYSRKQIDNTILELVKQSVQVAMEEHLKEHDPHNTISEVSTFSSPVSVDTSQLVTIQQLREATSSITPSVIYDGEGCVWITSGPVEKTVGYVEEGTTLADQLTLQEIMDLIFYGKEIEVESPAYAYAGTTVDVTMKIHGNSAFTHAELYQNGVLIGTYSPDDFTNNTLTVQSNPITEDTVFTFTVYYENGTELTAESTTLISYGIFVGLLPKFWSASLISYDYLLELVNDDPTNNIMIGDKGADLEEITFTYNFENPQSDPKHIFVALPKAYPDLISVQTPNGLLAVGDSQENFEKVVNPLIVPGFNGNPVDFKIYVFKNTTISLINYEVTFKFG